MYAILSVVETHSKDLLGKTEEKETILILLSRTNMHHVVRKHIQYISRIENAVPVAVNLKVTK